MRFAAIALAMLVCTGCITTTWRAEVKKNVDPFIGKPIAALDSDKRFGRAKGYPGDGTPSPDPPHYPERVYLFVGCFIAFQHEKDEIGTIVSWRYASPEKEHCAETTAPLIYPRM